MVLEGKDGAAELTSQDCLPKVKDKYGRDAYIYSTDRARRASQKRNSFATDTEMDLDAKQLEAVNARLDSYSFKLGGGKAKKIPKVLTEDEREALADTSKRKKIKARFIIILY